MIEAGIPPAPRRRRDPFQKVAQDGPKGTALLGVLLLTNRREPRECSENSGVPKAEVFALEKKCSSNPLVLLLPPGSPVNGSLNQKTMQTALKIVWDVLKATNSLFS